MRTALRAHVEAPTSGNLAVHLRKTKLCAFFPEGRCRQGSACDYAHSVLELKKAPDFRCMHMCRSFLRGRCKRATCKFAHGPQEIRQELTSPPCKPPSRTQRSARSRALEPATPWPSELCLAGLGAPPRALAPRGRGAAEPLASPAWPVGEDRPGQPEGACGPSGAPRAVPRVSREALWGALQAGVPLSL
ncbi:unnamed protein product [Prorocentrum cordatum]|uniref:C3H1-type domain-containing protein n=1 Tax=Prorocentrum cordatum TaxID=2364126 RepID=A0ABN9UV58_9DINO|nr:unnamed protein product [Polarella glacialis]